MNGVTGRMGLNQRLIRSVVAIRQQGGVTLANGDRVMPDPILVGRNSDKVAAIARQHGVERWTTDLSAALANAADTVFFDSATTQMRTDLLTQAIEAGKHIYCEKPVADSLDKALAVARLADKRGIKHGVVQDKLFLPGLRKLRMLRESGFFGRIFAVRASSATGCSKATGASRRNGRAGTTRKPKAAASFSTCCATGATCWTACSGASPP